MSYDVENRREESGPACIVPEDSDPILFINDIRIFESDAILQNLQRSNRKQAKLKFVQNLFSQSFSDFKRRDIMQVKTASKTEKQNELCEYCRSLKHFWSAPPAEEIQYWRVS